jgi:hypothetical protein
MKTIIASVFAVALIGASAANAQVHVGVHVGGVHVGVGAHTYHRPVYHRPAYHPVYHARHCWWSNHRHYCR